MAKSTDHKQRAAEASVISKLVLVQDAECELQVSTAIVSFANWDAAQEVRLRSLIASVTTICSRVCSLFAARSRS